MTIHKITPAEPQEIKVDSSAFFLPFDGMGNGIIKIVDSDGSYTMYAVIKVIDETTLLVGRPTKYVMDLN